MALSFSGGLLAANAGRALAPEGASRAQDPVRLFCFSVATPAEMLLLEAQAQDQAGIFSCDGWTIFSNTSDAGSLPAVAAISGSMDVAFGGEWRTALNVPPFLQVWPRILPTILETGKRFDWVLKLDADTVFDADRMRSLIQLEAANTNPQAETLLWVFAKTNASRTAGVQNPCFHRPWTASPCSLWVPGPLEAFSFGLIKAFGTMTTACSKLPSERYLASTEGTSMAPHNTTLSEDTWLSYCLMLTQDDALWELNPALRLPRLGALAAPELLHWVGNSPNVDDHEADMRGDHDQDICGSEGPGGAAPNLVAFHPAKTVERWRACRTAMAEATARFSRRAKHKGAARPVFLSS